MPSEWPMQEKEKLLTKKRILITVEVGGAKKNVWIDYKTEVASYVGTCTQCGKENQEMEIEKLIDVKVDSADPEIIYQAEDKLKQLIDTIERELFVCVDCHGEEFKRKLPGLYLAKLEELQGRLGIEVDKEEQRKAVLDNLKL